MKTTMYKCDRCGAELGECGAAVERAKFATQEIVLYMCCAICRHHGESLNKELCKSCGLGYLNNHFSWRGPQE